MQGTTGEGVNLFVLDWMNTKMVAACDVQLLTLKLSQESSVTALPP
jgi:hypothetical protein